MNIKEVNSRLYEQGIMRNMCQDAIDKWNHTLSEQELIDLWYDNYDFAVINHFPDNETIKKCFQQEVLRKNNILVDDEWSLLSPEKAMILGKSVTKIRFNTYNVGQVWVRDMSKAEIYVRDNADVTVCVLDDAIVNIVCYNKTARVLVIKYSKNARITSFGSNITIKENYNYLKE